MRLLLGMLALASAVAASCSSNPETELSSGGRSGTDAAAGTGGTFGTGGSAGASALDGGQDGGNIGRCSSTLPGVCIRFPVQQTSFTLAEARSGITFRYEVVIERDVGGVVTLPQDAGRCGSPDPGGLYVLEQVSGGAERYCICDTGLCFPPPETPVTLSAGVYPATFTWAGLNWEGPSDTGNPLGPPFPAGNYDFTVSAVGSRELDGGPVAFAVKGVLGIALVP